MNKKLSIIVPVFNEEATLETVLRNVTLLSIPNWDIEVVAVDDGSRDATPLILDKWKDKVVVIHASHNAGKGSAVKLGLEKATGDALLIQDADLEYNPGEIPLLINALSPGKVMVYGSRNIHHKKRSGSYIPRMGVWFMSALTNVLYGTKLTDIWTCYKLFPKEVKSFFVAGHFESEIIFTLRALKAGYTITEVPISHNPRDYSEGKKIRYRDGFKAVLIILKYRFHSK